MAASWLEQVEVLERAGDRRAAAERHDAGKRFLLKKQSNRLREEQLFYRHQTM